MRLAHRPLTLISALALSACFNAGEEGSTGAEATETGESTGDGDGDPATAGDGDGDTTTTTVGDGDGDESDSNGDGDGDTSSSTGDEEPPMLDNFTVAGSTSPPKILQSQVIELAIDASDNVEVDQVEFFEDGESIGLGTTSLMTPGRYTVERIISGEGFDGFHTYSAEAIDTSGNMASSEDIQLEVDVPASGTMLWERSFAPTSGGDQIADCVVTPDGRLAIVGNQGDNGSLVFYDGLTGVELDEWTKAGLGEDWNIQQIEPGADGTGVVIAQTQFSPDKLIEIVRYLDDGTELWNSGPIIESDSFLGVNAGGMATTSDLIYVAVEDFGSPGSFYVLDMQSGQVQCSTQIPGVEYVNDIVALDNGDAIMVGDEGGGWAGRYTSDCEEVWSITTLDNGYEGMWKTDSGTVLAVGTETNMTLDGSIREITVDGEPGPVTFTDWGQGRDELYAVAQTPTGITVVGGSAGDANAELFDSDLYVRGEQPLGQLVWENDPVAGPGNNADRVLTLCLDRAGNTYAGGYLLVDILDRDWYIAAFAP